MALTTTQKAQIRLYLGFSDMSRSTPTHWRLESMMLALSSEAEAAVGALLTSLATIDTAFTTTAALSSAGLKSVDNGGVEWFSATSSQQSLATNGRRLVNRLALTMGVEPYADVFGSGRTTSGACGIG